MLQGEYVLLEPLGERHRDGLYEALHGPGADTLWEFMPYGPFRKRGWDDFADSVARLDEPLFYAIVSRASGLPAGKAAFMRIKPEWGSIEIGGLVFSPNLQRTAAATEAVFLLAWHAFEKLRFRRIEWRCDARNERSRRAAERLGFTFEGVLRQHMVVKARSRDTAILSMLDGEWPALRRGFERWLAPQNFDGGRQRRSLGELRAELGGESR